MIVLVLAVGIISAWALHELMNLFQTTR